METSTPTYVNPLSDAGFKALLCDPANKPVLISMLNAFLPPDRTVEDLDYSTTEMPGLTLAGKASRVDLRCTDPQGRSFIVEVQRSYQPNFSVDASTTRPGSTHLGRGAATASVTTFSLYT